MPGSEEYFLSFNRDEIFKNLIAIEGHFRQVPRGNGYTGTVNASDLSCCVKHAADIEGHCDEAVSHALVVEGSSASERFAELRDRVKAFRNTIQDEGMTSAEGIRRVRELRGFFEGFNSRYDISKCTTCGPIPETLKPLLEQMKAPSYTDLESDLAEKVLAQVCRKYDVPTPALEIVSSCHSPTGGLYDPVTRTIKVCEGGANLHVLLHEAKHHIDAVAGRPMDEGEAEKFALHELDGKRLYGKPVNYQRGKSTMQTTRDIAIIYGADWVGLGINEAMQWIDAQYPGAVLGQNPSLLLDLLVAGGGAYLAMTQREPYDLLAALIGGYVSTDLWRQVERLTQPAARFVTAARASVQPGVVKAADVAVVGTAPMAKYVVTA